VGPRSGLDAVSKINSGPFRESNRSRLVRCLVTVVIELSQLLNAVWDIG